MRTEELNLEHFPFCQMLVAAVTLSVIQHVSQVDIVTHPVQPQTISFIWTGNSKEASLCLNKCVCISSGICSYFQINKLSEREQGNRLQDKRKSVRQMLFCAADYALKASHKTSRRQRARVEGKFFLAYLVLSLLLNEEGAWSNFQVQWILHKLSAIGILLCIIVHILNSTF